jgi:hypothetical protein
MELNQLVGGGLKHREFGLRRRGKNEDGKDHEKNAE